MMLSYPTSALQGFETAVSVASLQAHLVTAQELSVMVCGSTSSWSHGSRLLDIFHVFLGHQLRHEYALLADVFWKVPLPYK